MRKSSRILLREKSAVSDNEKKAETKRSKKKSISIKIIIVVEKCIESIKITFFYSIPFLFL
ncbi:MAG: hypothetical protein JETT_3448 [Candidatus Jettenia ecosi]|uniref:Uncharacterized protein n=1 Tax=Candidatus Jettenia ecosi TaxID=2494326 RepID=A0A533Q6P4_9BACT|nr:MAG: hypothetical protein JETT_3448 [Candidatus Jettenia ecosi]